MKEYRVSRARWRRNGGLESEEVYKYMNGGKKSKQSWMFEGEEGGRVSRGGWRRNGGIEREQKWIEIEWRQYE